MTDVLFFDGKCPACAHEITLLKRLNTTGLTLIDIHSTEFVELDVEKSRQELLAMLHLKTESGLWLMGLDATVRAWGHTPIGWLLKPLRWYGIKHIADFLYLKWAKRRICKLSY